MKLIHFLVVTLALAGFSRLAAGGLTATIRLSPPVETGYFKLGTTRNPAGHEISVNSSGLLFDNQPVFPVMGEFHYSRCPQNEWREELRKMKAGGVDIVATYVFWIHHEEIEGEWDWSGQRDLKNFLQACGEVGLKVVVRCGPWCHGEVRNGGIPDWVVAHKGWKLRATDTNFLAAVKILYGEISKQLHGELWKDGGPVIGIQVDNEFGGSPDYLMALKKIAIAADIDVPLYVKTGWPPMRQPVPLGELLPLFGAYPDGFWTRSLETMPGDNWKNFTFRNLRTDEGVGNDTLKAGQNGDTARTEKYPHLTCEIGGGMPASYHRRINYDPRDVEANVLTQLGGGSSLLGYYMYHGGQNPEGKHSTLQESRATGYPNDLPVKSYDFNAPLGEFGQINPQYYWLRRLHLFIHDFGMYNTPLAQMPATLPDLLPTNQADLSTLRWSVRSDGHYGFVFVNNYQRLQPLPAKTNVQFQLNLPGGQLVFPKTPVTIPADEFFFWPFDLNLAGMNLLYATAQPVGKADVGDVQFFYFAETPGVPAEFVFASQGPAATPAEFHNVKPGRQPAFTLTNTVGERIQIVLLNEADSLALQKTADGNMVFETAARYSSVAAKTKLIQSAGPLRKIPFAKDHLAMAPTDDDFTNAAVWRITLPKKLDARTNPVLRLHYVGDVARLTLDGKLLADNFYSGREFDLGLKRYLPKILKGDLRLEILPLRKNAPIFLEPKARPDFGTNESLSTLVSAEIISQTK